MPNARKVIFSSYVVPTKSVEGEETSVRHTEFLGSTSIDSLSKTLGGKGSASINATQWGDGWVSSSHHKGYWEDQGDVWELQGETWDGTLSLSTSPTDLTDDTSDLAFLYIKNTGDTNNCLVSLNGTSGNYYIVIPPNGSINIRGRTTLGNEELTNGGFDEDANWSKGGSATIAGGAGYLPEATTGTLSQASAIVAGKVYYYTLSAKSAANGTLNLSDGTSTHASITNVPAGYTTYSGYFTAANTSVTLSESSTGNIYIDSISVKEAETRCHEIFVKAQASTTTIEFIIAKE